MGVLYGRKRVILPSVKISLSTKLLHLVITYKGTQVLTLWNNRDSVLGYSRRLSDRDYLYDKFLLYPNIVNMGFDLVWVTFRVRSIALWSSGITVDLGSYRLSVLCGSVTSVRLRWLLNLGFSDWFSYELREPQYFTSKWLQISYEVRLPKYDSYNYQPNVCMTPGFLGGMRISIRLILPSPRVLLTPDLWVRFGDLNQLVLNHQSQVSTTPGFLWGEVISVRLVYSSNSGLNDFGFLMRYKVQ